MTKDQIKAVAKAHNISLKEIASKMQISEQALQYSLNRNMTISTFERIADAIGISPAEFYGGVSCNCPHCGKPININIT